MSVLQCLGSISAPDEATLKGKAPTGYNVPLLVLTVPHLLTSHERSVCGLGSDLFGINCPKEMTRNLSQRDDSQCCTSLSSWVGRWHPSVALQQYVHSKDSLPTTELTLDEPDCLSHCNWCPLHSNWGPPSRRPFVPRAHHSNFTQKPSIWDCCHPATDSRIM